jgi:hypothetical protein
MSRIGTYIADAFKKYKKTEKIEKPVVSTGTDKHFGYDVIEQHKCTCNSCGNIYYYADDDKIENMQNVFVGKFYKLSQLKDSNRCPRCDSKDVTQKKVCFMIDKKGNFVGVEEALAAKA